MSRSETTAGFRVPDEAPGDDWKALEIVYTRYVRGPDGSIAADPRSYVVCHQSIDQFIKARLDGRPLPGSCYTRRRHADDRAPDKPTDIYVGCKSYVVIELDPSLKACFAEGRPGVTTERDYGQTNWGLRHVTPDGIEYGGAGPAGADCRIVFFGVHERDDVERQTFHLHAVSDDQRKDPVTIDPDSPTDGGKFPLIDRTPCMGTQPGAPHCRP